MSCEILNLSSCDEKRVEVAWNLYLLVLVVDERGSFSAIDAHIFPCLVQTVLEDVD